jgi:hypothetical protein
MVGCALSWGAVVCVASSEVREGAFATRSMRGRSALTFQQQTSEHVD